LVAAKEVGALKEASSPSGKQSHSRARLLFHCLFQSYCFAPKLFWEERATILNASSPSLFHVFWVAILTAAGGLFSSSVSELVQRAGLSS
jgi:hypothetical protein